MKKNMIILVVLLVLASAAPLMAVEYEATSEPFAIHSLRSVSMGGAGLAVPGRADGLFINPASLGQKRFSLSIPSVAVTVYNVKDILDENIIDQFQDAIETDDDNKLLSAVQSYLGTIGYGKGQIVSTDASVAISLGSFGLGVVAQERLHTINDTGTTSGINMVAEVNAGLIAGYGLRIPFSSSISLDVGASAKLVYRSYSEAIPLLDTATKMVNDEDALDTLMAETPVMGGYALPVDVGATLNLPFGLSVGAVARNLNGTYKMTVYDSADIFLQTVESRKMFETGTASFSMNTPWSLDVGFAWAPKISGGVLKPTIAIDLVDVIGFAESDEPIEHRLVNRLNAGAEVKLLNMFDLRLGLNQGYMSVGGGIDLFVGRVDVAYYWREFGEQIGDKPVDALSVRVNLGFDR